MKTINESIREQACQELRPAELQEIQGGSPTLALPPPGSIEWRLLWWHTDLFYQGPTIPAN
jgi:hypothetical protein